MTVDEIMTRDVITVSPETGIHAAARLMVDHGVSGLPVVDDQGQLVGIISEGDLIIRQRPRERASWWRSFFSDSEQLAREYQKRAGVTVGEVMTRAVVSAGPELSLESVAAILDKHRIRRVPIVSGGTLVGIVSRGDLIKSLAAGLPSRAPLSDAQLVQEMKARLATEPWAPPSIVVEAKNGVVSLWGLVQGPAERAACETMARAIEGCKGVDNRLAVRSAAPYHYGS
jgi:CBS-domain-containing membrane protein